MAMNTMNCNHLTSLGLKGLNSNPRVTFYQLIITLSSCTNHPIT